MLSILIPIYQFDVRPLVRALDLQAQSLGIPYEICCFDDASGVFWQEQNREIAALSSVRYQEMPQNLGRSRIRNALGRAARFEYLLFMDCDAAVVTPDFLAVYLAACAPDRVVVGMRVYDPNPPADPAQYLRWLYGIQREQKPAAVRNRTPYHAFCSAHFLCPKAIFTQTPFDESLDQYGHEDTQFGFDLRSREVPIVHIDAPLRHIDLEPATVFLKKSRQAIENLVQLKKTGSTVETRLLLSFEKLQKWGLGRWLAWIFSWFSRPMERQLLSSRPSLRVFDLYKLSYLAYQIRQQGHTPSA